MNIPVRTVYVAPIDPVGGLAELDRVRLVVSVQDDEGGSIAAGSRGTNVAIWKAGAAYEVEFEQPFHTLATVEARGLERAMME